MATKLRALLPYGHYTMFSQSLAAQLARMLLLLTLTLLAVHNYKPLLELLAQQAVDMGCHQQNGDQDPATPSHHH